MDEYEPLIGESVVVVDVKRREDMGYIGMSGRIAQRGDQFVLVNERGSFNLDLVVVERDRRAY